jgi:hypothetical protein
MFLLLGVNLNFATPSVSIPNSCSQKERAKEEIDYSAVV